MNKETAAQYDIVRQTKYLANFEFEPDNEGDYC